MKLAFCIREDYDTQVGGDSIQLLKTKEYLEKSFQITIDIVTNPDKLHGEYDIVHIFNLATRKITLAFFEKATALNLKIALSTIFWNYSYQAGKDIAKLTGYRIPVMPWQAEAINLFCRITAALFNKPRILARSFRNLCRNAMNKADILLPNSIEELQELCHFTGLPFEEIKQKTNVVVNAATFSTSETDDDVCKEFQIPDKFILQIGRIEYIKNQLNLIKAFKNDKDIAIVFIGKVNEQAYFRKVKKCAEKRGNVYFIDHIQHNKINSFYRKALVHVLPSFRESPGLVSLEALSQQCRIVVSGKTFAPVETYCFTENATIVNPTSLKSIRSGVLQEIARERNMKQISEKVQSHFNWKVAAEQTFAAYQKLLN